MPEDSKPHYPDQPGWTHSTQTGETAQAQQQVANDAPVDINPNAVLARVQGQSMARMADNFEAGASRRNIIADELMRQTPK